MSIGRHELIGFTFFSRYSCHVSCWSLCGLSLYFAWISFMSGWSSCIFFMPSVDLRVSGQKIRRTRIVRRMIATPKFGIHPLKRFKTHTSG